MTTLASILGIVLELAPNDKVPGVYLQTRFGVGGASTGEPKYLLLVGAKHKSSGTYTTNSTPVDIYQDSDADTYFGAGSEVARMCYAALSVGGVRIKACAPTITSGAAGTATLTIDGTWTTTGTWSLRVAGVPLVGSVLSTDGPDDVAANMVDAVNDDTRLPVTASSAAGSGTDYVVTFSAKSYGARGNSITIYQDKTYLPSGMTSVLAGGTALANGAVPLASGAGTENISTLLSVLAGERYWRIAAAQIDATNIGRWVTQLDTKAGPLVAMTEHLVLGSAASLSTAGGLAQSNADNQRICMLWMPEAETPMPDIAAWFAAIRAQREQQSPNQNYDNIVCPFAAPQTNLATNPSVHSVQVAALDYGLTPLVTQNNNVKILRAITTRTLTSGGAVDNGTIDVADSAVPDAIRDELASYYTNEFAVSNPFLDDDPAPEDQPPPLGTGYPKLWTSLATNNVLRPRARDNWITKVDQYPMVAQLNPNSVTPRIVFYCPVVRKPHQHQLEGTIAQTVFRPNT